MTLPEIPDGAVEAADSAFVQAGPIYGHTPLPILAAAWPFLYAAALRHAADEVDVPSEIVSDESKVDWAYWRARRVTSDRLRELADEATTPKEKP